MRHVIVCLVLVLTVTNAHGDMSSTDHDSDPARAEDSSPCSAPAPLGCWPNESDTVAFRIDPVILMPSGRYTTTTPPELNEINPFPDGRFDLKLQMGGVDFAIGDGGGRFRGGLNLGIGVTEYEDAGLIVVSWSFFVDVVTAYRIEIGEMHARSGRDVKPKSEEGALNDKTAFYFGVSFPVVSNGIRRLLGRLGN